MPETPKPERNATPSVPPTTGEPTEAEKAVPPPARLIPLSAVPSLQRALRVALAVDLDADAASQLTCADMVKACIIGFYEVCRLKGILQAERAQEAHSEAQQQSVSEAFAAADACERAGDLPQARQHVRRAVALLDPEQEPE